MKRVNGHNTVFTDAQMTKAKRTIKHDLMFEKFSRISGVAILVLTAIYAYYIYNAPSSSMIGISDLIIILIMILGSYELLRSSKEHRKDADRLIQEYSL